MQAKEYEKIGGKIMKKSTRKLIALLAAGSIAVCGLTACGEEGSSNAESGNSTSTSSPESSSDSKGGAAELGEVPDGFNYTPVANKDGREIKIATLTVSNNPFWNTVVDGIKTAKDYLENQNVTVDIIEFDDFDGQAFSDALDTCVAKGYDAVTTVGVADTIVPAIDRATDAGIPVYTFNSDTAKESKRVAFVGQDLYAAGGVAAENLVELMGDSGKVGIITGFYNVSAHELRRQGAEEELSKHAGIEIVGSVENHDSGDEAYTATKDFITANPDLTGLIVTAGGPQGAAKALEELKLADQVTLVCFDTTDEIVQYVKSGAIKATVTQDPFGQGCDPIILAYNQVVTGNTEVTGNAFTKMDVYTPDNIKTAFPD